MYIGYFLWSHKSILRKSMFSSQQTTKQGEEKNSILKVQIIECTKSDLYVTQTQSHGRVFHDIRSKSSLSI